MLSPARTRASQRFASYLLGIPLVFAATACGGYLGSARREYTAGRYLEAAEELGQHEEELGDLSEKRKAEYGMYRGLSLLQLGDYAGATKWLSFAYTIEQANPGTLKDEQRTMLERGLRQLTQVTAPATAPADMPPDVTKEGSAQGP